MARVNICLPEPRKVPDLKFLCAHGGTPFEFFFLSTLGAIIGPLFWWRQAVEMEPAPPSGSGSQRSPCEALSPRGFSLAPIITQDLSTKT
jgi:hypothetical protein